MSSTEPSIPSDIAVSGQDQPASREQDLRRYCSRWSRSTATTIFARTPQDLPTEGTPPVSRVNERTGRGQCPGWSRCTGSVRVPCEGSISFFFKTRKLPRSHLITGCRKASALQERERAPTVSPPCRRPRPNLEDYNDCIRK